MDESIKTRVVTLGDLIRILIKHWWIMLLVLLISIGMVFGINCLTLMFAPKYESKATLYILRREEINIHDSADADFALALKVVNDCTYLLKSHAVVDAVIEQMNLDMEYDSLRKQIFTTNPENTRILEVSVRADSPDLAKNIVDLLCEIGQLKIADAMGFKQVNLYEYGVYNDSPCNRIGLPSYILVGMAAVVITYSVLFIKFLYQDRCEKGELPEDNC